MQWPPGGSHRAFRPGQSSPLFGEIGAKADKQTLPVAGPKKAVKIEALPAVPQDKEVEYWSLRHAWARLPGATRQRLAMVDSTAGGVPVDHHRLCRDNGAQMWFPGASVLPLSVERSSPMADSRLKRSHTAAPGKRQSVRSWLATGANPGRQDVSPAVTCGDFSGWHDQPARIPTAYGHRSSITWASRGCGA